MFYVVFDLVLCTLRVHDRFLVFLASNDLRFSCEIGSGGRASPVWSFSALFLSGFLLFL